MRWAAPRRAAVALAACLLAGTGARSQESEPARPEADARGTVRGLVHGPDESPVEGAEVEVTIEPGGARRAATDAKGRFTIPGLPAGTWPIRVSARGFFPSVGLVRVGAAAEPLVVELRSLDEGSPAFVEGDPNRLAIEWIERGNVLLEQGRAATARAEYEKALAVLRADGRAPVLRALARTHWIEGAVEETVRALEQALLADPAADDSLRLYRAVMEELGRDAEAERFLAELPARAAEARASEPPPSTAPRAAPAVPVPVAATPHRTGELTLRHGGRNPLSNVDELARRYALSPAELLASDPGTLEYRGDDESFDVFVPDGYRPDEEWGLLVWVSPTDRGGVRSDAVRELLAERRLIWIGANRAGNRRSWYDRVALALDGLELANGFYRIDERRVFTAGYSGGGRIATQLAFLFPELFRGGVFWMGVDYFRVLAVPYRPGHSWPRGFHPPPEPQLESLRRDGRFALVTGERDFNRSETHAVFRALRDDGFRGVAYFEIPGADHYHGLDAAWLGKALGHLEAETRR